MRNNRLKDVLAEGRTALGASLGFHSPDTVEFLGFLGFDYVTLDLEHEVFDELAVLHSIRAAESVGVTPIVRVGNDRECILRLLDAGAQGIHVPRINTKADAESIVSAARYFPLGTRSYFANARSGDYGINVTEAEYAEAANRETLVTAQLEEMEAVQNLEEILAVPGIDVIQVGPKDLWQSLGMPDRHQVQDIVDDVIERAVSAGKWVSSYVWLNSTFSDQVMRLRQLKVQMFTVSARDLLASGARKFLEIRRK